MAVEIPFIEVYIMFQLLVIFKSQTDPRVRHLTNVHARESWRHTSYLSDKAQAVIAGLGPFGYTGTLLRSQVELGSS